jgi:dolichol-phosphate mannosyltransferase
MVSSIRLVFDGVLPGMSTSQEQAPPDRKVRVSLILPLSAGKALCAQDIDAYRQALAVAAGESAAGVEVLIAEAVSESDPSRNGTCKADWVDSLPPSNVRVMRVKSPGEGWASVVRAALNAASGEQLVVIDPRRGYSPESLARLARRLAANDWDLAVGIPRLEDVGLFGWLQLHLGFGLVSRLFLGTSDIFSGLFAIRRSVWEHEAHHISTGDSSLILDLLSRHRARCIDVKVGGGRALKPRGVGIGHIRPLKHLLDLRFGNYSRLVQFCMVGASGMVIDLTCYALFQWVFSFTALYTLRTAAFGVSSHVAVARALSIAIALVWNFTFNRRLTFNDARKEGLARQFLTYVLSNALAIAFNFSVSLYLPGKVGFFARHKLAAAVVAIVAATGISFSMSRWLVFAQRPGPRIKPPAPHERPRVQTSAAR